MNFSQGDRVIIRVDVDSLVDPLFNAIDGLKATIFDIYQNMYEPETNRFEVELDYPVRVEGEIVKTVPGLYEDNLEPLDETEIHKKMNEGFTLSFNEWTNLA